MAVKWIGDAAQELGLSPLDAVEILASRQEYPMNGLVDEDRFKTLRLMRGAHRLESSGSAAMPVPARPAPRAAVPVATEAPEAPAPPLPPPPPAPEPFVAAPPPRRGPVGEATSITAPLKTIPESGGERTVIIPPLDRKP
jgi:hypothetical protein